MKKVFCRILIVSLGFVISGCEESNCNIIYHSNTDKALNRDIVRKSMIKSLKLQEPTREGYTFEGWYFDMEFTKKYDADNFSESNNELYAKWSINSYRVTVHNEDEEFEYLFEYGDVIDLNPVYKDDYDFDRYYFDEELTEEFNLVNMPAYDIDLYPKFNKKLHYFTFVYHPNNDEHYSNIVLERNELNNLVLPEPTREGYTFEGWFFDANFEKPFILENAQEGINELHGKWMVNSYRITIFNEEDVTEYSFSFGDPIALNSIVKYDYAFEGYYLDKELTEEFDLVNMPSTDIYLFPKFSKILHYYTFIFRAENGNYYSPITLERDDLDSLEIPNVTKEGYTFDGWYLDNEYQVEFSLNNIKEGNNELYAKWSINSYKVVIHNEGEEIESIFNYDEPVRIKPIEKFDYTFEGYFTDKDLSIPFELGNMPSHDIDLYPKFTKILHFYTFNYYADNGFSYPSITLERDNLNTLELQIPIKEGYTFMGWFTDSELTNEFLLENAVEGTNYLFAKWEVNSYKIMVHNGTENIEYMFNYGEIVKLNDLAKDDYTFGGYYLDEEFVNIFTPSLMPSHDVDLYPKFNKILHYYTFILSADNGEHLTHITLEKELLNGLQLLEPVKEGYTFDGWFTDRELTIEFNLENAIEGNNYLFAKWNINNYQIIVHDGNEKSIYRFNYGQEINIPKIRNFEHNFAGYFTDSGCNDKFEMTNMPAYDFELYAKYCEHNWHKGTSELYDIYCTKCGYRSLPIINIDTEEEITKEYVSSKVSVIAGSSNYDIVEANCKVKVRGNGTASYAKKPYRLKFDKKQKMLGLNNNLEAKSWVLLAEWNGWFMKTFFAFDLSRQIFNGEYYCSDYTFVILTINNEYNGMYLLAEQQQVNGGRIDIYEPSDGYEGTNIGYLVEMDIYATDEENYFSVDYGESLISADGVEITVDNMVPYYTIKSDTYNDNQNEYIKNVIQKTYDLLRDTLLNDHSNLSTNPYKTLDNEFNLVDDSSIKTAKEAIERVIDYESLLRMAIISELCQDYDLGWSSFYINYDASKENPRLVFEAPWDYDLAFDFGEQIFDENPYIFSSNTTWHQYYNMWFMIFAHADWFSKDMHEKYEELGVHDIISNSITNLENLTYSNSVYLYDNYCRWPEICNFDISTIDEFMRSYKQLNEWFIDFVNTKRTNFENYLDNFKEEEKYKINFVTSNGGTIIVYEGKDFTANGIETNLYELGDISGSGQVNFKVIVPEGFEIESISVSGSYKNLKGPSDTGAENVYRVTKVASDLTIVVTLRAL